MLTLILERQAEAQDCIERWNAQPKATPIHSSTFAAPADLIVFLNAANMKSTVEALKRSKITVTADGVGDEASAPFLISITSDGDSATRKIMPVAQWLSMPGLAFRKYDAQRCEIGQFYMPSQSIAYRHSAASIPEMRSHEVKSAEDLDKCVNTPPYNMPAWPYFAVDGKDGKQCFKIMRGDLSDKHENPCNRQTIWNDTPAFVMDVPSAVIPNHTNIFQEGTANLLIAISNHYNNLLNSSTLLTTPPRSETTPR